MIKNILIGSVWAFSSAAFAAEAPLSLSAGEHGEYSRVVIADGGDISIETSGRIVRIRNSGEETNVDLSDINDRKKAYRIDSAVSSAPGVIEFQMNCDCTVRTSHTVDGKTVIDVVGQAEMVTADSPSDKSDQTTTLPANTETSASNDALTVAQAQDRMIELLQQAADDGLIMFKEPENPAQNESTSESDSQAQFESREGNERPAVISSAQNAQQIADEPARAPRQCLSDQTLMIDGKDLEDDPLIKIEALQNRLADAADNEKSAAAKKLAGGFIAVGFGEEAMAVLKDVNKPDSVLFEIAHIIAEYPIDPDGALLGAENCTGAHALWQAVAADGSSAAGFYERSGNAIETLPTRLQSLVLSRLAVKMVDAEAWQAAQNLLEMADESGNGESPEFKYVRIRLADHETQDDASRSSLLEVANAGSAASDDALLALAESYAEQGGAPHEGFIEDIGALAKIGGSSRAAFFEAYSWAQAGNIRAALLLLRNEAPKSPENKKMAAATANAIIARALSGDDSLLKLSALEALLQHEDWIDPSGNQRGLRINAADFASEIGLPNLSYELLAKANAAPDREMSEKIARAALAAGAEDDAIKYAAPYATDSDFGAIVANAKIQQQDFHAALAAAATISDEKKRARLKSRAGWLSRNWKAALDGFRHIDPNEFDDAAAIRFALTAYMNGEPSLPGAVDAALSAQASTIKSGLHSLFTNKFEGTTLERARSVSDATTREISAFEEILSDG